MNKVISTNLPLESTLHQRIQPMDFIDCYCIQSDLSPCDAAEIITNFPVWARLLVNLRNIITLPFGLLKEGPEAENKVGFFPIESENHNELIAGFNDKHLDFRVSVISKNRCVFLATWVHTHSTLGQLYLKAILQFHIFIVRNALARVKNQAP